MHRMVAVMVVALLMRPATGLAQAKAGIRELADSQIGRFADWRMAGLDFSRAEARYRVAMPLPALPQQPANKRSWPGRHPVLFGVLVGAGAGLAIEAVVIPGASGGEPHSAYIPMFVCTGAGIGSLLGLIMSR